VKKVKVKRNYKAFDGIVEVFVDIEIVDEIDRLEMIEYKKFVEDFHMIFV
jgi:hypothetical protein